MNAFILSRKMALVDMTREDITVPFASINREMRPGPMRAYKDRSGLFQYIHDRKPLTPFTPMAREAIDKSTSTCAGGCGAIVYPDTDQGGYRNGPWYCDECFERERKRMAAGGRGEEVVSKS
jgi:hypothetical protein